MEELEAVFIDWPAMLKEAEAEVGTKLPTTIEIETAYKWAARACAAAKRGMTEAACDFAHEAIEHAALSGDDGTLGDVRGLLAEHGVRY